SPPCVPFWSGNNGGATARGVSGSAIEGLVSGYSAGYADLQSFFNRRFQFYGRSLHLTDVSATVGIGDVTTQRSWADGFTQQYRPFAATGADQTAYTDEL